MTDPAENPDKNQPLLHMRDDYLQEALKVIDDPNILVNVVSRRVKQLRRGHRALVESLEKAFRRGSRPARNHRAQDPSYELPTAAELALM